MKFLIEWAITRRGQPFVATAVQIRRQTSEVVAVTSLPPPPGRGRRPRLIRPGSSDYQQLTAARKQSRDDERSCPP